ncbi:MAG: hypothetical protein ACE5JL_00390 [Dehalococcoidia bacterium]
MTFRTLLLPLPLFVALALMPWRVAGETTLRLQSGRELPLSGGRLRFEYAQTLLREAEDFLNQGRLDLARDNCQVLLAKGDATLAPEATSLMARIDEIERSSFVVLKNGQTFKGKLHVKLRSSQLGVGERREIPLWKIKRIEVDYLIKYSLVSRTNYVVTILDVQFRDAPPMRTRLTEEIIIKVAEEDGVVRRVVLGYPYELLRKEGMGKRFPQMIQDRVSKVVVYPVLYEGEGPRSGEER